MGGACKEGVSEARIARHTNANPDGGTSSLPYLGPPHTISAPVGNEEMTGGGGLVLQSAGAEMAIILRDGSATPME